jgi:cytochrome c-type biogenesis protein CcmF
LANWKRTTTGYLKSLLLKPWIASVVLGALAPFSMSEKYEPGAAIAVFITSWIMLSLLADIIYRLRHSEGLVQGLRKLSLSYYAMVIAHAGIAVTVIGIAFTSLYSEHRDLRMEVGQKVSLRDYDFILEELAKVKGPNYVADEARIRVMHNDEFLQEMKPQKRRYLASGTVMTEVALDPGLFRDLYVAMGEPLTDTAWAMRVHVKPFVRWIWLGALMMALGAILSVADKRYRKAVPKPQEQKIAVSGVLANE